MGRFRILHSTGYGYLGLAATKGWKEPISGLGKGTKYLTDI